MLMCGIKTMKILKEPRFQLPNTSQKERIKAFAGGNDGMECCDLQSLCEDTFTIEGSPLNLHTFCHSLQLVQLQDHVAATIRAVLSLLLSSCIMWIYGF